MSWYFIKAGGDKASLKAAVQGEQHCPQGIRDQLCAQIDAATLEKEEILLVEAMGHWDPPTSYLSSSFNEAKQRVLKTRLISWES